MIHSDLAGDEWRAAMSGAIATLRRVRKEEAQNAGNPDDAAAASQLQGELAMGSASEGVVVSEVEEGEEEILDEEVEESEEREECEEY